MYIFLFADRLLRFLTPLAFCLTTYLYLYTVFHACAFPLKYGSPVSALSYTLKQHWPFAPTTGGPEEHWRAPFRLLVLADPQLEGDSSLPGPEDAFLPKLRRHWEHWRTGADGNIKSRTVEVLREIWLYDMPESLQGLRKRLDLLGNDYYLGHIYRTLHWWSQPSHVTVLGDLIGSQWVTDEEFEWRGWRYWNRVFPSGVRVEDEITQPIKDAEEHVFDITDASWKTRIINIAGNHDIGYAGEVSERRMDRFERVFGNADWDVRFQLPAANVSSDETTKEPPSLHLIVLNSLVLDGPALSKDLQTKAYDYLNNLISHRARPVEDRSSLTLLLTHLPLYKPKGICVDAPHFDYWGNDDGGGVYKPHGVKEQNHLSEHVSHHGTLEALFGMSGDLDAPAQGRGRAGLILNGHDHEGCDTWHFINRTSVYVQSADDAESRRTQWEASQWKRANLNESHTGVREITLRSMMGDYGGNAGLLSAWFDSERGEWDFDIQMCGLNVKLWWLVHIIDLICLGLLIFILGHSLLLPSLAKNQARLAPQTSPGLKAADHILK